MSTLLDDPRQEYAAPPRRKGVSRGRKLLVAVMTLGAISAISSGGTFASFTASTDNAGASDTDATNPFQTGRFELLNTVLNADGTTKDNSGPGASPNCSTATDDLNDGVDNNHAMCDYLFSGATNTIVRTGGIASYVKIENAGDSPTGNGKLVFALAPTGACAVGALAPTSNCDKVFVTVQEYAVGATPGSGNGSNVFTDANRVAECVFGGIGTVNTATTPDSFTSADRDADAVTATTANQGVCQYGRSLAQLPAFASHVTIAETLPAADGTTGVNENNDVRYFKIHAQVPQTDCGTVDAPSYAGANDTTPADGFHDTTGIGCHNQVQDTSATFTLRWMLIES